MLFSFDITREKSIMTPSETLYYIYILDWLSLQEDNFISGNIIYNYCRTVIQDNKIYIDSDLMWQRLEDNQDEEISSWLPNKHKGQFFCKLCQKTLDIG